MRTALTGTTRFSGCGAKLGPGVLEKALCGLEQPTYKEVLADFSHCEDAGLYDMGSGLALVQTVDFFPPIVDDPFLFGRIAAANALSDVYAMCGAPKTALALVCYPVEKLGLESLREALAGGLDALKEAGCALLGGHSVDDGEPKLGYAVTGVVEIARTWRNHTPRKGDALILTKPIGTGLANMALRAALDSPEARSAAERSMATLNRKAAETLAAFGVHACTDVTGFGLAGHAAEMAGGTECGVRIDFGAVPLLPGAAQYAAMGLVPAGTGRNKAGRLGAARVGAGIGPVELDILFDPQTSGGLLAALDPRDARDALAALADAGVGAALIGEAAGEPGTVALER